MRGKTREYLWRYRYIVVAALLIVTIFGVGTALKLTVYGRRAANLQEGIAEEIIRFHVIANSDSEEDQALKMEVKEAVVNYMAKELGSDEGIDQTRAYIETHLHELETIAKQVINEKGFNYPVEAKLANCYFPMKSYGDCTFPAGEYEALRVCIGEAAGKNWWCVLYPNLCFIDSIHAIVPEEQKEELKNILTEDEYSSLFDWKDNDYRITTKWFGNKQ